MTPEQKNDRRFRLWCLLPVFILTWVVYSIVASYDPTQVASNPFAPLLILGGSLMFSMLTFSLIIDHPPVKEWREQLTGYKLPEPEPPSEEEQHKSANVVLGLFAALLAVFWVIFDLPASSPTQAIFCILGFIVSIAGAFIGFNYPAFYLKYGGALLGWTFGILLLQVASNLPVGYYIAALGVPALAGSLIQGWWNKQDFVIERRRQKAAENAQRDIARQAEIRTQAEAQQRAQEEAALKAKLDTINSVSKPPPSSTSLLSPAAQRIADEIARRRK